MLRPPTSSTERELDFPYYSLRDGFNSTMNLVSDSPHPIDLTMVFYSRSGEDLLMAATIAPGQKLAFDLRRTLASLGADTRGVFSEGSIAVLFEGTIMPVVGQVTITNPALKLVHESEMVEDDPGRSDIPPVLNSLWWNLGGGRDATFMVSNMSVNTATADVYLDFGGKRHTAAPLVFTPHETRTVSVLKLLGELSSSASEAPEGGITIIARGPNPKLIAQGRVLDPVTGFSTTLEFPDPALQKSRALHAVGLPVGAPPKGTPYAGTGSFTPHVVVRNLLPNPQTVTVTLEYPTGNYKVQGPGAAAEKRGKKEFDGEAGEGTQMLPLGPFSIAGFSTQDISLDAALGQLPLPLPYCSVRIQYSGAPGTMIAQVSSVDVNQDLVVDARAMNEGDGWAGSGANPWHLDNQTESMLLLTNESDKPARIGFSVSVAQVSSPAAGNGVPYYLTSLKLNPHETRAISVRRLRDAQLADLRGTKIPANASDGAVHWIRLDNVPVSGRVLVIRRNGGAASSYDCGTCMCDADYFNLEVSPGSATIIAGGGAQFAAVASYEDCNAQEFQWDVTGYSDWETSSPSVAVVDNGYAAGAAAGSANISASYSDCAEWVWDDPGWCECWWQMSYTGYGSVTVADSTPEITGLDPSVWTPGQTTQVTITGLYFGTNAPTLGFSPSSGISYTLSSYSDTQIVAMITVASGTPNEDVAVTVTNNGYGGSGFTGVPAGQSPTSNPAYARVSAPLGSPEITVVAWINGNAPDLATLPTGENSTLFGNLNGSATTCGEEIIEWALFKVRADLHSSADVTYANAWLLKHSANAAPPNSIAPYTYEQNAGNYRLFNDFGGAGGGAGSYAVGITPDPCGFGNTPNWIGQGERSQESGSAISPSGEIYQLAEGRIGSMGQRGSETINGRTVPWVWSVIEFDSNLDPNYSNRAIFPTYSVYRNGQLVDTYPQSSVATFVAKDDTYKLTRSQIP